MNRQLQLLHLPVTPYQVQALQTIDLHFTHHYYNFMKTQNFVILSHALIWKRPAFVKYFIPLKDRYFCRVYY